MARTTTASNDTPSKDPSKMSKGELLRMYKATVIEKEDFHKKYDKAFKKYRRTKRALDANQSSYGPAQKELIPYPTGQTPGRGDFNLSDFLLEKSDVSKETYNSFVASIHEAMTAAGIPKTSTWSVVRAGPLAEVLDVIREKYPWLGDYDADWAATSVIKQYLRGNRNRARRRARADTTDVATAAAD